MKDQTPIRLKAEMPSVVADARQAFVKFLGASISRVPLSCTTIDEIVRSGCHWALAYPAARRPRSVKDDDIVFIGRLIHTPNDIRIFGRAIGIKHQPGRDDATSADIKRRPWKKRWSRYVRVHHVEFVAGTMANGVSLNELMDALDSDSFASTQQNAVSGTGNTNPRQAYLQQPAVKLSPEGLLWLGERLQVAFNTHGKLPRDTFEHLD